MRLAGSEHAVRAQRIGDDVQIWLCSDCGHMVHKIDAVLAQVADHGPTKSLHRRLLKLRDKLQSAESRRAAGALSREDLHRELNQIGAHLRDLSRKHPQFDDLCFFESFKLWTKAQRIKDAQLPSEGAVRYVPPESWRPSTPLPRGPRYGYMDRFGREWTKGPSRTRGEPFEWDVQLPDGDHWNVSLKGRVTH